MERKLWSIDELAAYLGYARRTVCNKVQRGEIPYVKVGRLVRFVPEEIDRWVMQGGDRPSRERERKGTRKAPVSREPIDLQIGSEIVRLRQAKGLSQTGLAAIAGTSRTSISLLERGSANLTLRTLQKVASALGVKLEVRFQMASCSALGNSQRD